MKKVVLFALTVSLLAGVACNKVKQTSKRMTGKWNISKKEYTYSFNNTVDPSVSFTVESVGSLELNSDGTGTFMDPNKDKSTSSWTVTSWYNSETELAILVKDANGYTAAFNFTGVSDSKDAQTLTWNYKNNKNRAGLLIEEKAVYTLAKAE